MNLLQAVISCLQKYIGFGGRASRAEYWWYMLFYIVLSIVAQLINDKLASVVYFSLMLPTVAVGMRRLHDIGKSGWYMLIWLVAVIGWVIMIYWAVQPGQPNTNQYGQEPDA
jgi:uncharacterized membrane protein YhaH (DUF805 family)